MCVGGWLAKEHVWDKIEEAWIRRINYEKNLSVKQGYKPISRYHATDCSNFKREFSRSNGWDEDRQKSLTKRIINIMSENKPAGIVIGGGVDDYLRTFSSDAKVWKEGLYFFSISMCLYEIANLVAGTYPNERVNVFYERGKFAGMAERAFRSMMDDPRNAHVAKYFVTMVPVGWEDCVAIQSADFLAYEGYKRVDGSINGREAIRRSLQELVGKNNALTIGYFGDKAFKHLAERKKKELQELGLCERATMKRSSKPSKYSTFENLTRSLLKVPHSEIKAKLEEEKAEKKRKKLKDSSASREVNGRA